MTVEYGEGEGPRQDGQDDVAPDDGKRNVRVRVLVTPICPTRPQPRLAEGRQEPGSCVVLALVVLLVDQRSEVVKDALAHLLAVHLEA